MAHDGTGTGWDTTAPADSDLRSLGAKEIRDLRLAMGIRLNKEHVTLASSSAGGEHKAGSAVAYTDPTVSFPVNKPDGSTILDSADEGRLAIIAGKLFVYTGDDTDLWGAASSGSFTIASLNTFISWIEVGYAFRMIVISQSGGMNGIIVFNGTSDEDSRFLNTHSSGGDFERLEFETEQDSGTPTDPYRFRVRSATVTATFSYEIIR